MAEVAPGRKHRSYLIGVSRFAANPMLQKVAFFIH